ncbi:response regulator transcription factor [Sphingomonas sp. PAMC 26605]|uniref:response regulator transcription factor n=1 Tax=Sphingomonas sp. PAMC 26605 TaxID=1112214 RepID=UPI00026CAB9E|nr:response regulator [Sphingomonas sp. PAMC 26605]
MNRSNYSSPSQSQLPVIHVVDDEEWVRSSIAFLLENEGYQVFHWEDGHSFLERGTRNGTNEIALIDIRMPELDGFDVQARLNAADDPLPVILLTGHADVNLAVRAMKGGAIDFIEKPFEAMVLLNAIREALAERAVTTLRRKRYSEAARAVERLTERELEVLQGLTAGGSNKEIAQRLNLSPRTVETHRGSLMAKLGATRLSTALRIAFLAELDEKVEGL